MASACVSGFAHLLNTPLRLHDLHDSERSWPQTNCSVDLLIEVVAAYGFNPVWMLAFTVMQDFEGDHFTFFKVPADDMEALYGLSIQELAVWDDLENHVLEQLRRNRVVLVEVDGFYLPDTRGVTYRDKHGKTTIGIYSLDPSLQQMAYFHNETRGVLDSEDYAGVLQKLPGQSQFLMPYCEVLKPMPVPSSHPVEIAKHQLQRHWLRRPVKNPFLAYAQVFPEHIEQLRLRGPEYFHHYAFNTLRQAGANFGLLESFLLSLGDVDLVSASMLARSLAEEAKILQFRLARAVMRNRFDGLADALTVMAKTYDHLMGQLAQTRLLKDLSL